MMCELFKQFPCLTGRKIVGFDLTKLFEKCVKFFVILVFELVVG